MTERARHGLHPHRISYSLPDGNATNILTKSPMGEDRGRACHELHPHRNRLLAAKSRRIRSASFTWARLVYTL